MNKFKNFFVVLFNIVIWTFVSFGGGNAIFPVIKKLAVDRKQWISEQQFDDIVIIASSIPGPSVIEVIAYVAINRLGKFLGTLVTVIGCLPHILFFFALFVVANKYLPIKYLYVINVSIISCVIGMLLAFSWRYIKQSQKEIGLPRMIILVVLSFIFCLFVKSPYNNSVILLIAAVLIVCISHYIKYQKTKKITGEN